MGDCAGSDSLSPYGRRQERDAVTSVIQRFGAGRDAPPLFLDKMNQMGYLLWVVAAFSIRSRQEKLDFKRGAYQEESALGVKRE